MRCFNLRYLFKNKNKSGSFKWNPCFFLFFFFFRPVNMHYSLFFPGFSLSTSLISLLLFLFMGYSLCFSTLIFVYCTLSPCTTTVKFKIETSKSFCNWFSMEIIMVGFLACVCSECRSAIDV